MPIRNKKFHNLSKKEGEFYCETAVGNYYLPIDAGRDSVAESMMRGELFEPEIISIAKQYITEGSTVLDVGANFGQMSIEFSKWVGNQGLVYAFEAQDTVFNYLEKILKRIIVKIL